MSRTNRIPGPGGRVRALLVIALLLIGGQVTYPSAEAQVGQPPPASPPKFVVPVSPRSPTVVAGKVIVAVDPRASVTNVRKLAGRVNGTILRSHTAIHAYVLKVPVGTELAAVRSLRGQPQVRYAEPDYIRHLDNIPTPNDPLYRQQWNLAKISAPDGWNVFPDCLASCQGARANGPLVSIVDSGIDLTNPDLAGRATGDPDGYGHGTHVAGIIVAAANNGVGVSGLAYNVRLASYRACDSSGKCDDGDVINSIEAAVALGAKVINLSLGSLQDSLAECDAVDQAVEAGVVVVAAAGNDGVLGLEYPAACSSALAVSASNSNDGIASFSNGDFGAHFLVAAPGVNVWSTLPNNPALRLNSPTGFGTLSGTSMATPHVTALVALMKGENPTLTLPEIMILLAENADKVGGSYRLNADQICPINHACSWNDRFGYGRINVARTLCAAAPSANKPRVAGISPASAKVTDSANVTITGRCFFGVSKVVFDQIGGRLGAIAKSFTVDSPSQIRAAAFPLPAGRYDVEVYTSSGMSMPSSADVFTSIPVVVGVSPSSGRIQGGTTVTITGAGFDYSGFNPPGVFFGTTPSQNVSCSDGTTCTVASPPDNPGPVDVTVSVNGATSLPTPATDQFTYLGPAITRISPSFGPEAGGTDVDIYGVSFAQGMTVRFCGMSNCATSANVLCNGSDDTWCIVRSPAGTGTVDIIVTVNGVSSSPTPADRFTYKPFPSVSGISPTSGPEAGGTTITITGTGFSTESGATTVTFTVPIVPDVTVPAQCSSTFTCTVTSPPGKGIAQLHLNFDGMTRWIGEFGYLAPGGPTIGAWSDGPGSVEVTGKGFTPNGTVSITISAGDVVVATDAPTADVSGSFDDQGISIDYYKLYCGKTRLTVTATDQATGTVATDTTGVKCGLPR